MFQLTVEMIMQNKIPQGCHLYYCKLCRPWGDFRLFAAAYPWIQFTQPLVAQIQSNEESNSIVQVPLAQLSWYHHNTLLDKVKDLETRFFYIQKTIENGWSRDVMVHQIASKLHTRQGLVSQ